MEEILQLIQITPWPVFFFKFERRSILEIANEISEFP